MPILRQSAARWHVEEDRSAETEIFSLTDEGERFLRSVLSLKDGDEFRPKDLAFLVERGWAVRVEEEEEAEVEVEEPSPLPPPMLEEPGSESPAEPPRRAEGHPRPSMARRTRGREIALQVLYLVEQNPSVDPDEVDRFIVRRLRDPRLQEFAHALVDGVKAHRPEIDELISGVAENWRIDRMAAIDRNILRLGAFELLHCPEVPRKVAINEALELAKRYSTAQSSRFVNGILDRLRPGDGPPPEPLPPPEGSV